MKKLALLLTLSLGAFAFADDEGASVPNCPPGCGVKTDKNSDKKPVKKVKSPRTRLR